MAQKLIISCAVTGAVHTPSMSPYLPKTPKEIAKSAIEAAEAGATVVHCHARNEDGSPTIAVDKFREIGEIIKANSNVVVCFTTGGSATAPITDRIAVVRELQPELCSFTPGSVDFATFPMAKKDREWINDWEKPMIEATEDSVFAHSFATIKHYAEQFKKSGTRPEFEIFDISMLNNIKWFIDQGLIDEPTYLQYVLGILGGSPGDTETLVALVQASRRIIDNKFFFSVCGGGNNQYGLAATAISMGSTGTRVGLEDSLWLGKGEMATSNAAAVEKIIRLAKDLGREPATPDEGREILSLKGKANVNY
jgi:uncharacterized protein (DUF849 family)